MNEKTLDLRDIHLPDAISWWPLAPGWWILLASAIAIILVFIIAIKVYRSRRLKRDIHTELEGIKNTFQQTQNKSQLAKSLSILLRRTSISYYPETRSNSAGLTGERWLNWLDETTHSPQEDKKFQSDIGKTLITAPYLPDNTDLDFDAQALIDLSQHWLLSRHKKTQAHAS